MPLLPQSVLNEQALRQHPFFGTPGGYLNLVIPCFSVTTLDTIELTSIGLVQFSNKYYDQEVFGFIADATPTAGPLFANVNDLGDVAIYLGSSPAGDAAITLGDYCQLVYDSALGTDGGFHLFNWTQAGNGGLSLTTVGTSGPATLAGGVLNVPDYSSSGTERIETTAGPFIVLATDGALILNKAVPSATSVILGPVAARDGLPLTITDFGLNAGDITITPNGAETVPISIVGSGGSIILVPSVALNGWYVQ